MRHFDPTYVRGGSNPDPSFSARILLPPGADIVRDINLAMPASYERTQPANEAARRAGG